jgi:hypothetical protein
MSHRLCGWRCEGEQAIAEKNKVIRLDRRGFISHEWRKLHARRKKKR